MPEGYCAKCKAKKEITAAVKETMKNGRSAIKGQCPDCRTEMYKVLDRLFGTPAPADRGRHLRDLDCAPNRSEAVSPNA